MSTEIKLKSLNKNDYFTLQNIITMLTNNIFASNNYPTSQPTAHTLTAALLANNAN
ncbi:TPA: hypothetical protein ACX6Q7_001543 [Photobacterium damselae]